jgi:hypothetical protein
MRNILWMVGAVALALAVVAVVVIAGDDTTVFVSPPEAVAEEFTRQLATGRYDMALEHLEHNEPGMLPVVRTSAENLRAQAGAVNNVEGESPSAISGDRASAAVTITTDKAGEVEWTFELVRRDYEWKISEWK